MKIIYRGDDFAHYETKGQAMLADIIHASGMYLEIYKIKELVEKIDSKIFFTLVEEEGAESNGIATPNTKIKDM